MISLFIFVFHFHYSLNARRIVVPVTLSMAGVVQRDDANCFAREIKRFTPQWEVTRHACLSFRCESRR